MLESKVHIITCHKGTGREQSYSSRLSFNVGARWEWVANVPSLPLYPPPPKLPGSLRTGGRRADLDGSEKPRPHRDWIPEPSSL